MKSYNTKQLKTLLLSGVLSLSLFFGGCSSTSSNLGTVHNLNAVQSTSDNTTTLSSTTMPSDASEATVQRVVDGDTIKVTLKDSGETVSLRLLLIDTPESVKPGVDPQPYSIDASNYAKELIKAGDTVYIEYDSGDKTDKYDRHLCYLWFYDKDDSQWKMFNETMVEKGLARVGYIYSQKRHLDTLYAAQDIAKANKLNIWSVDGYVTDSGFDVDAYNNGGGSSDSTTSNDSNSSSNDNTSVDSDTNQSTSVEIVYANGGSSSSNKYHSSAHAHGMKGAIEMTESQAISEGYVPCGTCYK